MKVKELLDHMERSGSAGKKTGIEKIVVSWLKTLHFRAAFESFNMEQLAIRGGKTSQLHTQLD